jgi:hypothetical protein
VRTFVVRVWTPAEPAVEEQGALRGLVEHVGSGRSAPFADELELLAFLREAVLADSSLPSTPTIAPGGGP